MLKVIAEDFIKTEAIETVMPLYRELIEATKQEPLCISYDLYVDQKNPGHFVFIEEWPDQQALDIHCASEHFKRLVPLINSYKKSDPIIKLMNNAFEPES